MFPPTQNIDLNIEAISGILGSISIACWVVVFSPQIIENFRRRSADGLSIVFIVVWLAGDIFNILGSVLQGVLPTMIILAVYYTIADIVLLGQCFYYKGFTLRDEPTPPKPTTSADLEESPIIDESAPLLTNGNDNNSRHAHTNGSHGAHRISDYERGRRSSSSSFAERLLSTNVDGTHLSPANPQLPTRREDLLNLPSPQSPQRTLIKSVVLNTLAIVLVILAGVLGWYLSNRPSHNAPPELHKPEHGDTSKEKALNFNVLGQVFGYICAVLYLASRVPQLLLNYRRKSTEGISMLFFIFACLGNLTYVLSIFAYSPTCDRPTHCRNGEAGAIYGRYIAVNASWLLGSMGTLFLDAAVFIQYFMYKKEEDDL